MTIYIINGKGKLTETINDVNPAEAGAIGTYAVGLLDLQGDDEAYWTDELPKGSLSARPKVERSTYQDENGETVYQIATRTAEVRVDGWLV